MDVSHETPMLTNTNPRQPMVCVLLYVYSAQSALLPAEPK